MVLSTLVASTLLALAAAAGPLPAWQFTKLIVPPDEQRAGFVELSFDSEVFAGASGTLADLRVVDSAGTEVPYVLATEAPKYTREPKSVRLYNRGITPGVSSTFSLDLGEQAGYHNQLTIATDSRNFRREVVLEGSSDEASWVTIPGTRFIYDYTLEFTARDTTVRYPEANYRYLRLTMKDNGEQPINVQRVELVREVATPARSVSYAPTLLNVSQRPDLKVSQVVFDLGTKGLPTSSLALAVSSTNFNRAVALEGSDDNATWASVLARDVIFSYRTPQFQGSKLELSYRESGYRYLRLTVFNRDDQPVAITGATATGLLRKLVFSYQPGQTYRLYYGNTKAQRPEYDLANYLDYYGTAGRQQATLGAQAANPTYEPPAPPTVPFTEQHKSLLFITLVLAVGVVGTLTVRLMRRAG